MGEQDKRTIGQTLRKLPRNRAIVLKNITCPYCGSDLEKGTTDKEHVIGRRFVPKGKLNGNWNLIVNSCRTCNGIKADLENDISAITMQPDGFGRHGYDDPVGVAEAVRKSENSFSRQTKKLVKDSHEKVEVKVPFGEQAAFTF